MKRRIPIILGVTFIIAAIVVSVVTLFEFKRNAAVAKIPSRPPSNEKTDLIKVVKSPEADLPYSESQIENACAYVDGRWDCSDFRLATLIRLIYKDGDGLMDRSRSRIKKSMLGFRYWMTEPGRDSMCFWSENHQILFASAEYLAGRLWPNEIFTNDGRKGEAHAASARERILIWLEQRWTYGFTEWYSNVYYVEDIAALANLVDFAGDAEIVSKARIVIDLLLHDLATQSFRGHFLSTSGRSYETGKKSAAGDSMRAVTQNVWDWPVNPDGRAGMELNFLLTKNYKVPAVLREIGRELGPAVIKASSGLDVKELREEGLVGPADRQIMMQWAMEAFTQPEVISNSMAYIERNGLLSNAFLNDFTSVNLSVLKRLRLLPLVSQILSPQANGTAIERANTYTYRCPDYLLATTQEYHPGSYYDQHHIVAATLGKISVFHTHPAVNEGERGPNGNSPTYWVGGGHLPHAAQDLNVSMAVYRLPTKASPLEKPILQFTHAWFPTASFKDFEVAGNYAFAAYETAYLALVGITPLELRDTGNELIQRGRDTAWIIELAGSGEYPDFDTFKAAIRTRPLTWKDGRLAYGPPGRALEIRYRNGFFKEGKKVDTNYPRFESPWAQIGRKPTTIKIRAGGKELFLDFAHMVREERDEGLVLRR